MPRRARVLSATGIYHIISRGASKQIIFEDESDRLFYLNALMTVLTEEKATLLAWCLMNNHTHLLIRFADEPGRAMKRINVKYAEHFNHKYDRCGHLFQDRYKSEPVETESYLQGVTRYIHHNPARAGVVRDYKEYIWSSYVEYIDTALYCETDTVLASFGGPNAFSEFHETYVGGAERVLTDEKAPLLTDEEARALINREMGEKAVKAVSTMTRIERDSAIRRMRQLGLDCRQVERLTGVSYGVVKRC